MSSAVAENVAKFPPYFAHRKKEKERAVDLVMLGFSFPAVAREIGVHRTTIWRWMRSDTAFYAAMKLGRKTRRFTHQATALGNFLYGG